MLQFFKIVCEVISISKEFKMYDDVNKDYEVSCTIVVIVKADINIEAFLHPLL